MKHITTTLRCLVVCLAAAAFIASCPQAFAAGKPVWEVVSAPDGDTPASVSETAARLDVLVRDGAVYITVDTPMKIEVFTILGQLVTSKTVAAGTVRLSLGHRGVYILKGAGTTKRVNL